ncbi:Uncharacterised protein [Legionella donaldsonii]|uniref:Uncharacterized protein n=1 Tax=Legionella donaldsonii TaxID=45060 RepID=A0A378JBS4_9GAMM|nr:Uncharacterised protein [Legionella donaldsonii]
MVESGVYGCWFNRDCEALLIKVIQPALKAGCRLVILRQVSF